MNKKGFTLVELLAVIIILALLLTITATKGFGAFNNTKTAINSQNIKAIEEAARTYLVDVEHCDNDLEEVVELREVIGDTSIDTCESLRTALNNEKLISINSLVNAGYISGSDIKNLENNENAEISVSFKNDGSFNIDVSSLAILLNNDTSNLKQLTLDKDNLKRYFDTVDGDITEIKFIYDVKSGKTGIGYKDECKDNKCKITIYSRNQILAPKDSSYLFNGLSSLEKIDFTNFDTRNVTNMKAMFQNCSALSSLDVSNFNTSNVTDMGWMFYGCSNLKNINGLTKFNTEIVTNMYCMFYGCRSLTSLNLTSFNTSSLQTDGSGNNKVGIAYMFYGCSDLTTIYATSNFVINNKVYSNNMFYGCTNLIGGNGTVYNGSKIDKTYARIDRNGYPGYFREKNN